MMTRLAGLIAVLGLLGADDPQRLVVEVDAGPHERRETPVFLAWPEGLERPRGVALEEIEDGRAVPAQVVPGERPGVAWIIRDLPAGSKRRYRLTPLDRDRGEENATCRDDGRGLTLTVGGRPVLRYNHATIEPPSGIDPLYRRSGFIHPLTTPSGRVVTDDFAPDHAHQHGLFFAWVNTTFDGHKVDFWNQQGRTGRVRHVAVLGTENGPVFAQFAARLSHEDITTPDAPVVVLDEVWTVRTYNVEGAFLVDFESVQTCAGLKPLEINKYHYGGLGLRGNRAWFDPQAEGEGRPDPSRNGESDFLTSEGKGRADGNHTRPRWAGLSGKVDGRFAGVAILDHPDNFRFPQPVRLHPNKPYDCFAPMVLGSFAIEPGRPYASRYRLVLHDGRPDPEAIDRRWRDYAEPPTVRVVTGR
jgi:hypothetical protein